MLREQLDDRPERAEHAPDRLIEPGVRVRGVVAGGLRVAEDGGHQRAARLGRVPVLVELPLADQQAADVQLSSSRA